MISASGTVVLGFSLTGSVVPAGEGTLLVLAGEVTSDCLSEFLFSDSAGGALVSQFSVEPVDGCTDMDACNYNPSANTDDGSCEYAEENFDCDGNCLLEVDCEGTCGGDVEEDCFGECGGSAEFDQCGECGGDGTGCDTGCEEGVDVCLSVNGNNLDYESTADIAGFNLITMVV
jgi:hypothetical protein